MSQRGQIELYRVEAWWSLKKAWWNVLKEKNSESEIYAALDLLLKPIESVDCTQA